MNTGQTIITIVAFVFLTTILVNFYGLVASTGDDISSGQDGILETTIATSYMELAQGLSYDEIIDSSDIAIHNSRALSHLPRISDLMCRQRTAFRTSTISTTSMALW